MAELAVHQPRLIHEVMVYPHIHQMQAEVVLTTEEADPCPAAQHAVDDLTRDLLGALTDVLLRYAMVGGKDEVLPGAQLGA